MNRMWRRSLYSLLQRQQPLSGNIRTTQPIPKVFKYGGNRSINYGHDMHKEMVAGSAKVSITEYDDGGFVVNNVNMRGSIILLSELPMLWKPKSFDEITLESVAIFAIVNPAIEILVLGCGARIERSLPAPITDFLKSNGIVVEYLDSVNACGTFNILNAEDRNVAAALLPIASQSKLS